MVRLGAWLSNPYIAFAAGACVETVAYFVVHLVLDRFGRKLPYCAFVFAFGIVALMVVPIQMLMIKHSSGRHSTCSNSFSNQSSIVFHLEQIAIMFIVYVALKFLASGSYAIIYIYANELFPTQSRNTCMGICSMVARIGAIIGTLSNDILVMNKFFIFISISITFERIHIGSTVDSFSYCFLWCCVTDCSWLCNDLS
jgi:MFS family permease